MKEITNWYKNGFLRTQKKRKYFNERRIGSEIKFPFVNEDGSAVRKNTVEHFWNFLEQKGWKVIVDDRLKKPVGAKTAGEYNSTVCRAETGHCIIEFSLAHVGNLHNLKKMYGNLKSTLLEFSQSHNAYFLGYGMQPVEKPGRHLVMKKSRNLFWEILFGSNRVVPKKDGSDVHLFALSAANQVHIDLEEDEAIKAVNVLNGFAGSQIALTANSNIWQGGVHHGVESLGELFWDWWLENDRERAGVPPKRFESLVDYTKFIGEFSPVFVRRGEKVVGLPDYQSFANYFSGNGSKEGILPDGSPIEVTPEEQDISLHNTFFWHDARISRYFTIENRLNDQQPFDEMIAIPALTLGLIENLNEADEYLRQFDWDELRLCRDLAIYRGMSTTINGTPIENHYNTMIDIAHRGLKNRNRSEEEFLHPLYDRIRKQYNPARKAVRIFQEEGLDAFLKEYRV